MPEASVATPLAGAFPPRLVARLHREMFEGTLRMQAGGVTRVIYFRRGDIASAASNADEDRLHNILIRDGRLTGPQVEMARARQRPGVSLGKTLIELGFLTPGELLQGARRQVRQILAASFALTDGTSQVVPGPLPKEVTVLGLPARRLIFDALMVAGDRQAVVREMGSMESVYRATGLFREGVLSLRLDPAQAEVAALVDGSATLREISGRTRLDDLTVSKIVLALEILGLVEAAGPARAPEPVASSRRIVVESDAAPEAEVEATTPVPPIMPEEEPASVAASAAPAEPAAPTGAPAPTTQEAEDEIDDRPPVPVSELPAFAAPPPEPAGWQVDPETGERVHAGPVELTFDGPVTPPPPKRAAGGRFLAVAAVVIVIVVGAYAAVRLRPRAAAPAESTPPAPSPQSEKPGAIAAPPTTAPPVEAPPIEAPPAVEPLAVEPPAAAAPEPEPVAAAPAAPDLLPGQRLLDAGAVERAAEAFRGALATLSGERLTVQMMIACEAETVRKARAATRPAAELFVAPITVKDRSCYRVLWGLYASRQEAEAAALSLHPYFAAAGVRPAIVPIARLRRPS